jgi:hypothetical protein
LIADSASFFRLGFTGHQNGLMTANPTTGFLPSHPVFSLSSFSAQAASAGVNVQAVSVPRWPLSPIPFTMSREGWVRAMK